MHEPTKEEAMGIAAIQEIATLRARLERYREALEMARHRLYLGKPYAARRIIDEALALAPDASKEKT